MNRFGIQRPLSKKKCFLILSLLPLYFIVVGLFMQPVDQIFRGIVEIIAVFSHALFLCVRVQLFYAF